ncbi:UNVERIFIED_CONTAM: hypothetical protein Sradi_6662500 [Sesamum radiatum]|uniref:Uncharacterized protein n=1 Tax=Sesamum radiatum TaxID=300843 RepID=A0AAW2JNH0_SESRA
MTGTYLAPTNGALPLGPLRPTDLFPEPPCRNTSWHFFRRVIPNTHGNHSTNDCGGHLIIDGDIGPNPCSNSVRCGRLKRRK